MSTVSFRLVLTLLILEMSASSSLFAKVYGLSGPRKAVFAMHVTGGGVGAFAEAFGTPGASSSLMEGLVPYSRASFRNFMDDDVESFCGKGSAVKMAHRSRQKATRYYLEDFGLAAVAEANIFGVACTASLVTNRPKRGDHRAFVAVATDSGTVEYAVTLDKGRRSRDEEDALVTTVIKEAIASAAGVGWMCAEGGWVLGKGGVITGDGLDSGDHVQMTVQEAAAPSATSTLERILNGTISKSLFIPRIGTEQGEGSTDTAFVCLEDIDLPPGTVVYPGSFNPLHVGHVALAQAAQHAVRREHDCDSLPTIIFEISALNADKPAITTNELSARLEQFSPQSPLIKEAGLAAGSYGVCVSSAPLFGKKSLLYPACNFVMGTDTFTRVINPKYYSNSHSEMVATLAAMHARGVAVYVGGRVTDGGSFSTMESSMADTSPLPGAVRDMFKGIPEDSFRVDISSTELRAQIK